MRRPVPGPARWSLCAALAVGSAAAAGTQNIEIRAGGCTADVGLVARNAPLGSVLEELSRTLRFKLHLQEPAEARVDVALSAPAPELLKQLLASHGRFIVTTTRDPKCAGRPRVARVWLLAGAAPSANAAAAAKAAATAPAARASAARAAARPVTQTATPDQLREAEARSRRLKAAYDAHVAQHGEPPSGEEQEEAGP